MSSELEIVVYNEKYKDKWDKFLENSINGTFLQSRQFLMYHPDSRFIDNSILFINGGNIVAVIPANVINEEKKILISHQGSTFGGIILAPSSLNISALEQIFNKLENYLIENKFDEIILKEPGKIYLKDSFELLEYFYYYKGYSVSVEVGYYIDYLNYKDEIISNFSASRRRDYRYSLKNELYFKQIDTKEEILSFYNILCDNYKKFNKSPIHSQQELLDLKFNLLNQYIDFYAVYYNNEMIAGSMIFKFGKQVFHTQYLAVRQDMTKIFANEFLYKNLIETAKKLGYQYISFGTSTFEKGKILNKKLALYKESFGSSEYVNRSYSKQIK